MLDKISAICSIAGFLISIITIIYAFLIEQRIRTFEKDVLFNTRVPFLEGGLKKCHFQLSDSLGVKNERNIKETLNTCRTIIEDINSKSPNVIRKHGDKICKILKKQYKSTLILEINKKKPSKWYFWISVATIDNLWETYDMIDSFLTKIDGFKKDKRIIR